ncbi:Hypothetical protein NTJ_13172 [Nesidiocoris tenuis]|uniref:Uncharacterized protein n=1 Tax=Nesidiocoris tenuis TaxID=355587 RepID=A0ABN7B7I5_9HEMI|nr:Hypothetical protein NTJ_13172 [Nesidiocoris tenuis]
MRLPRCGIQGKTSKIVIPRRALAFPEPGNFPGKIPIPPPCLPSRRNYPVHKALPAASLPPSAFGFRDYAKFSFVGLELFENIKL